MSRIGQNPIPLPDGVTITQEDGVTTVKGPKGTLARQLPPAISWKIEGGQIICERPSDSKEHRSLHGLTRTLVDNMVVGVTKVNEKRMEVQGVGYRAELQGANLSLLVGLSHPVVMEPMPGIEFEVGIDTKGGYIVSGTTQRMPFVIVRCIDKEVLGQQCANIRRSGPAEPYKGRGHPLLRREDKDARSARPARPLARSRN